MIILWYFFIIFESFSFHRDYLHERVTSIILFLCTINGRTKVLGVWNDMRQ